MNKRQIAKRRLSEEITVKQAQRKLQRELLSVDCSVDIKPRSFNGRKISDKVLPVAVVKFPDEANSSEIRRKVMSVVEDFGLTSIFNRDKESKRLSVSVYLRMLDEDDFPRISFRDVVDEVRSAIREAGLI